MGMNEVESCWGQVKSKAGDKEFVSVLGGLDQAQMTVGKVLL